MIKVLGLVTLRALTIGLCLFIAGGLIVGSFLVVEYANNLHPIAGFASVCLIVGIVIAGFSSHA